MQRATSVQRTTGALRARSSDDRTRKPGNHRLDAPSASLAASCWTGHGVLSRIRSRLHARAFLQEVRWPHVRMASRWPEFDASMPSSPFGNSLSFNIAPRAGSRKPPMMRSFDGFLEAVHASGDGAPSPRAVNEYTRSGGQMSAARR